MWKRWRDDEEAAVATEYGFLIVFIAIAVAIGAVVLGLALAGVFQESGTTIGSTEIPTVPSGD
jgi:Flp pilus assembly pilin Flp